MIAEHARLIELAKRVPRYFTMNPLLEVQTSSGVEHQYEFTLTDGEHDAPKPVLGLFAGVHGIEAIGVKILVSFLEHLVEQLSWNKNLRTQLTKIKIVGIPVINPHGFVANRRCNGNSVDLMRNSPVECVDPVFLIGGQRFSPSLPYYRGSEWERENVSLVSLVRREIFSAPFAVALDLHSGFGLTDYLWTPYAKQRGVPPTWAAYSTLRDTLDVALKHHVYRFEVQSQTYCTSGDVWDFLYDEFIATNGDEKLFLPLTLEVGSWAWIRKSPHTVYRLRNFFNPAHPHREKRAIRRHRALLEFLTNIVQSYDNVFDDAMRSRNRSLFCETSLASSIIR